MRALFLDFDGVIVDSVHECYLVSLDLLYEETGESAVSEEHKHLFFSHRGLVKPSWQFLALHKAIVLHLVNRDVSVPEFFKKFCDILNQKERQNLEDKFFHIRKRYQKKMDKWLKLNPLKTFGKHLQKRPLKDYHIVTTKNRDAVELLLHHHKVKICKIFDVEDFRKNGSKGTIISKIMDQSDYTNAIFVDDATDHLDTVKDSRVSCFFADWGYGKNSHYPVFVQKLWNGKS